MKQFPTATKQFRALHEKLPKRQPYILIRNEDVGRRTRGAIPKGTSMTSTGSLFRGGKLVAATALALGLLTTASFAYTQEQQQLCTGDAMRLCGSEIPDVDRVTACMIAKQAHLSDGCKSVFRKIEPATPAAAPVNYPPTGKPHQPLKITPIKRG